MNRWAVVASGLLLGAVAMVHLARLFFPFEIVIASYAIPEWVNLIGFLVAGSLSALLLQTARQL